MDISLEISYIQGDNNLPFGYNLKVSFLCYLIWLGCWGWCWRKVLVTIIGTGRFAKIIFTLCTTYSHFYCATFRSTRNLPTFKPSS